MIEPQDRFADKLIPDPGFSGDDGASDPVLVAALDAAGPGAGPDADARASAALVGARLLVPVVAVLDEAETGQDGLRREKSSHMATVSVLAPDGRRALLAFTGTDALRAWDPAARPIAATATRAAQAALTEGAAALLVHTAASAGTSGPPHAVTGARLAALAQGRAWVPLWRDPDLAAALHALLLGPGRDPGVSEVAAVRLLPDDGGTVVLECQPPVAQMPRDDPDNSTTTDDCARWRALAEAAAAALAADPLVRERCPGGLAIAVLPPG